ncbi:MAG: phosphonate transporter, permease protein PhnE [Pseudomonadota bacterium]
MVDIAFGPEPGPRHTGKGAEYLRMMRRKRVYGGLILVVFVGMMASGFGLAEDRNAGGFLSGLQQLDDFPAEVLSEAWDKADLLPAQMAKALPSLIETVNIAAVSTLIGVLAASVLSLWGTRGLAPIPALVPVVRRLLDALRAVPEVVIALILIYVLGGGPIPAMVAIALHTAGAMGKLFSEVAENADTKPVEGLSSVGARWSQQMWLGIIPQVAPNWLSYALLRFEINVRASAILGFVGAGGIGYDLKIAMQWGAGRYDEVVAIFLVLFLTIFAIDQASDRIRHKIVKGV